jgi:hypothetical protein
MNPYLLLYVPSNLRLKRLIFCTEFIYVFRMTYKKRLLFADTIFPYKPF